MPQLNWSKVQKTLSCWIWLGSREGGGYGVYKVKSKSYMVHRLAYEEHKGEIPEGYHVDHLCGVPLCVNPEHLEAVTVKENAGRWKAQVNCCRRGHPYTEINSYIARSGERVCRVCRGEREKGLHGKTALAGSRKLSQMHPPTLEVAALIDAPVQPERPVGRPATGRSTVAVTARLTIVEHSELVRLAESKKMGISALAAEIIQQKLIDLRG